MYGKVKLFCACIEIWLSFVTLLCTQRKETPGRDTLITHKMAAYTLKNAHNLAVLLVSVCPFECSAPYCAVSKCNLSHVRIMT